MNYDYDVIIIGCGMSGIAAGIRLAYYDKKVLICEKHAICGGLNSYYRRKGKILDVGLHAMTNYVDSKKRRAPLNKLLRQLKISWDSLSLVQQKKSIIKFPQKSLYFSNDINFLINEVAEKFPNDADNFVKFIEYIKNFDALSLTKDTFLSSRKVIKSFISSDLLVEMIMCPLMYYGSAWEDDMDFSQFVIMFNSIFIEGFCRPFDGVTRIIKLLEDKYKENGGEISYNSQVDNILIKDNKAYGVKLKSGKIITASKIMSSAGICETEYITEHKISKQNSVPGQMGFTEVIMWLDNYLSDFDYENTIMFYNMTDKFNYKMPQDYISLESGVICSPDNFSYTSAKNRPNPILRVTNIANYKLWKNADNYSQLKDKYYEKIIENTKKLVPLNSTKINFYDMFTPNTITKYTSHINGTVYGSPNKSKDGSTLIDNLYICGTDQGFLGIIGAMLSGVSMANLYCLK